MPSAAKRRKAARKKKVKEPNINPSSDGQQGSDDLKSQDERGSDIGEVSLSANDDFSDYESIGNVKTNEDIAVKIDRELKSEQSSDDKHGSIEHTESTEESNYGNETSNAASTDGSPSEKNSKGESYNSIPEATTSVFLGKSTDSAPAQITLITENTALKEAGNSVKAGNSVCEEKSSDTGSALLEKSVIAQVGAPDLDMKRNEDKVYAFSDKNVGTLSLEEPKPKEYDSKVPNSQYGSPIPESTNAIEHTKDSETLECPEDQPLVASDPQVRKTSWLNCCGLFEVLGSNR